MSITNYKKHLNIVKKNQIETKTLNIVKKIKLILKH